MIELNDLWFCAGVPTRKQKRLLSSVCGITYEAVRQWWTTTHDISNDHIAAIAKHFKANAHWLITGDGCIDAVEQRVPNDFASGVREPSIMTAVDFVERNRKKLESLSESELFKLIGQISKLADDIKKD